MIKFTVDGVAQPKGSTRMVPTAYGGPVITSANPKMKDWQEDVAWSAQEAYRGKPLLTPVSVTATFYLPRPNSVQALAHIRKPDLDKLLRCVCDALTGICFRDDCQVVDIHCYKRYAAFTPQTAIVVEELGEL